MSTFNIDDEIDKLVDKLTDQLKIKLRKMVERSEKIILKQYIASQKETVRAVKPKNMAPLQRQPDKKRTMARKVPKRENDYNEMSDDTFSDSE